jgi:hypothetical protein
MADHQLPLVNGKYLLEKFPGKGGWTFAAIPEVVQNKNNPFGWVKVKGSIDDFCFEQYKLMPMGNGKLFLPVKSEIRKKLGKKDGDFVHIILFTDNSTIKISTEILDCFKSEPDEIYNAFISFTQGEQKAYLDWIYEAKTENTKVNRIAEMMNRLQCNLKLSNKI